MNTKLLDLKQKLNNNDRKRKRNIQGECLCFYIELDMKTLKDLGKKVLKKKSLKEVELV